MREIKSLLLLHIGLLIYSSGFIASKYCSMQSFLSFKYFLFFGLQLLTLAVYAIIWQTVLKDMPLSVAYANKGITIIWGLLISYFVFREQITVMNIIGAFIIIVGISIVESGGHNDE